MKTAPALFPIKSFAFQVVTILSAVLMIGCTRTSPDSGARLVFSVPSKIVHSGRESAKLSGLDARFDSLGHVVLNVSGPGMGRVYCHRDLEHDQSSGPCDFSAFPAIKVEVPPGAARLIQVGLAYNDSATDSMTLKYGDATRDLVRGDNPVDILATTISTGSEGGHIRGRLLTGTNTGPTGLLETKIKPSGRPSFTLVVSEMYSGWFQTLSMSGLEIEYEVNGQPLFAQPVTKAYFENLQSASAPVMVRNDAQGDGYEVIGFFGAAAFTAGKSVMTSGSCSSGKFTSCLDASADFFGPFARMANGGLLSIDASTLSWSLLPGVESDITDFRVLYNPSLDLEVDVNFQRGFVRGEGLSDCGFMENYAGTQVLAGSVPVTQSSVTHSIANMATAGAVAVCPRRNGVNFQSANVYPDIFSHGGGQSGPYLRLEIMSGDSSSTVPTLTLGECYPANFRTFEGMGSTFNVTSDLTISNPSTAWLEFHNEVTCNTVISGPFTILSGTNQQSGSFWVKPVSAATNAAINPTLAGSDGVSYQPSYNMFNVASPKLDIAVSSAVVTGTCYQVNFKRTGAAGDALNNLADPVSLTHNAGSGFDYYDSFSNCQATVSPNNPISISSFSPFAQRYVRFHTAGTYSLTASASGFTSASVAVTASNGSNLASKILITAEGPQLLGQCNGIRVSHVNDAMVPVPVGPSGLSVTLTADNPDAQFYYDSYCSSAKSDSLASIPGDETYTVVYYRAPNGGTFNVSASSGVLQASITPITVSAPTDPNQAYLTYIAPKIKTIALASREFPRLITLSAPHGGTILCEKASSPSYTGWSSCGGEWDASTKQLQWTEADGFSKAWRFKIPGSAGKKDAIVDFFPGRLYMQRGQVPTIHTCNVTIAAGTNLDDIAVNFGGDAIVCLSPGSYSGGASFIDLMYGDMLLGAIDLTTGDPASTIDPIDGTNIMVSDENTVLANIQFLASTSGTTNQRLIDIAAPMGIFTSSNNIFASSNYHNVIMGNSSEMSIHSYSDRFYINAATGNHDAFYIDSPMDTGTNYIWNPTFGLQSGSSLVATALHFYTGSGIYELERVNFVNGQQNGTLVMTENASSGLRDVRIKNSTLSFVGPSGNLNRWPIWGDQDLTLALIDSNISVDMDRQFIKAFVSGPTQLNLLFDSSRIVMRQDQSVLFINNSSASDTQSITSDGSQFVRTQGSGNTTPTFMSGINAPHMLYSGGPSKICGPSSGSMWFAALDFSPNGSSTWAPPAPSTAMDTTNLVCQ